jgi:hypothetical protein
MKSAKKRINVFVSFVLTIIIITMLMLAGPASAIRVDINGLSNVAENSTETFTVSVDIESGENVPVQNVTVNIGDYSCTFSLAGTEISGTLCGNITVSLNNNVGYNGSVSGQYGYGYGYDASNATFAYRNYSFSTGYGYGYLSGYGYSASPYGELSYDITFTPWAVSADTTYAVSAVANVAGGIQYKPSSASTITITNVAAADDTTGGGSGDDDDSSGGASPTTTPQRQGIVVDNGLIVDLLDTIDPADLGVISLDPDTVEVTIEDTVTKKESATPAVLQEALSQAVTPEAQAAIQGLIDAVAAGDGRATISQTTEVFKIRDKTTGRSVFRTKVTLTVTADEDTEEIIFVHVIPKEAAADISNVIFTGAIPEILQADPIVKWRFTDVEQGEALDMAYIVEGEHQDVQTTSVAVYDKSEKVEVTVEPTPSDTPSEAPKKGSLAWLFWTILVVIAIAIVVVIVRKKRE